jgi:hypothetical protein
MTAGPIMDAGLQDLDGVGRHLRAPFSSGTWLAGARGG